MPTVTQATTTTRQIGSQRDHRVDFYRGIALAMIFVNHAPDNVWERYTSRNFGFSDAAELFVFLAGFASAFAYGRGFLAGNILVSTLKAWRRAGTLYLVHIFLTMATIALFAYGAMLLGNGALMEQHGIGYVLTKPLESFVGIVVLTQQLAFVNILPMYFVLLLMLPLHLALARISRGTMLGAAVLVWLVAGLLRLDLPAYPSPGSWFFNPFSWQLIFAIGLYCGFCKSESDAPAVPYHPVVYGAALAYVAFAFAFVGVRGLDQPLDLPMLFGQFDKSFVSLPRLLHVLALIYIFAHAPKTSPLAKVSRRNPFTALGRHSLPIFALGTLLALAAQVVKFGRPEDFALDTALIAGGLGFQFALAYYLEWWREAQRRPMKKSAVVASAARSPSGDTGAYKRPLGQRHDQQVALS